MLLAAQIDRDRWGRSSAWTKSNTVPGIKELISPRSWLRDTKIARSLCPSDSGKSVKVIHAETGKIGASSDAILQAALTDLHNSTSSDLSTARISFGTRPSHTRKVSITSDAVFDGDFGDMTFTRPTSRDFRDSNCTKSANKASAETCRILINTTTVFGLSSADLESKTATYHQSDGLTHAELINAAPAESGPAAVIFGTMLDFSFQDTEGKWQAYHRTANSNASPVTDTSQAGFTQHSRASFGPFQRDVKGKKPIYHKFMEDFDPISSRYTELAPQAPQLEADFDHVTRTASTSVICTCTPNDARLALELYLQSTKKQHKQVKHSLRRSGGLTYFVRSSSVNVELVQNLSKLYLNVEELRRLVMAEEEIVSSVTMTEIHRLMDRALTPVSHQVSALCGEMMGMSVVDNGWRKRRRAMKQKRKEDWKPRMRALSKMVDQADAWAQLVAIRITRARWAW